MVRQLYVIAALLLSTVSMADQIQGLTLVGKMNKYSSAGYSAIWGYTAPDGREYALLAVRTGTSIVDITDDNNLREVAFIPGSESTWRELKQYKQFAYVVTDSVDTGIQIIDLSKLPNEAKLVATYADLPQSHTLFIDDKIGVLYTMGGTGDKVVALSLADPLHPSEISRFGTTYVHDGHFKDGKAYLFEIMSKSWSVWDISDLKNPKMLKRTRDSNAPSVSFHNGWPTDDGKYVITTEETSGRTVKFWDIQDLNNIKIVAEWLPPNLLAHNVQIWGHYAYFSSYGGGLRVLDIKDPTKPVEVAFWARGTGKEQDFVSMWGCFPFFASGKVIGSDMEEGLVVLKFDRK